MQHMDLRPARVQNAVDFVAFVFGGDGHYAPVPDRGRAEYVVRSVAAILAGQVRFSDRDEDLSPLGISEGPNEAVQSDRGPA